MTRSKWPIRWPRLSEEFDAICNGNGPHPRGRLDDRAPKELERICRRAMAVEPKHRYASGAHLARDLEKWLAADAAARCS